MTIKATQHTGSTHRVTTPATSASSFSAADVQKLKKYFDDNGFDQLSGKSVALKDLKGDAAKDFKAFQKGMASDYPSQAQLATVEGKQILVVTENNDGGSFYGFYDPKSGKALATGSCSESGSPTWSR